jgi:hypothetical protein
VKTALISYPLETFTEILGNILEGFGLKAAKEREAMEFLLGNSEDVTPLAPVRHQGITGTLILMP